MIGRRFAPGILLPLTLCLLTLSLAATAPGATLGDNIRTAANVAPFQPQIRLNVQTQATAISGKDAIAQSRAREELISDATRQPAATPAFHTAFAQALNDEFAKLAQHKDARVRLNAAIVVAKVAEGASRAPDGGASCARLAPVVQTLLQDEADAVVLWALKGARYVLPATLAANSSAEPLAQRIVEIGRTRPAVIAAVYDALAVAPSSGPTGPKLLAVTVPSLHQVLQSRINQYHTGFPPDASAEARVATYLTDRTVYNSAGLSNDLKVRTIQLLSDLLGVAAQRAGDVTTEQRRELAYMARQVGGAIHVVGMTGWENDRTLQERTRPLHQLPINASASDIQGAVEPVYAALRNIPKFASLTPPPKLGEMPAGETTGPATGPADGGR